MAALKMLVPGRQVIFFPLMVRLISSKRLYSSYCASRFLQPIEIKILLGPTDLCHVHGVMEYWSGGQEKQKKVIFSFL